jgi:hypothetical protein
MYTTGLNSVHSCSYDYVDLTFGKVTGYVMCGNVSNLGRERFSFRRSEIKAASGVEWAL